MLGLANIPNYFSIKYFLSSWPINTNLWSCVISVGQGYLVNHSVSTTFTIIIVYLLLYFVISDHPVTVSIIVTALRFKFVYLLFLVWLRDLLDIYRVYFVVFPHLPWIVTYRFFNRFACWQVSQLPTYKRMMFIIPDQYKCWQISVSILSITGRIIYIWHRCNT